MNDSPTTDPVADRAAPASFPSSVNPPAPAVDAAVASSHASTGSITSTASTASTAATIDAKSPERASLRERIRARLAERSARRAARRQARARDDLDRAVLELAAGRWHDAEELATRTAAGAVQPATHWLLAARAADLQLGLDRRDSYLARAREAAADEPAPVLVAAAEMNLKRGALDVALEALQSLEKLGTLNSRALLLLARVYRSRGDFDRLRKLEPKLREARGIEPAQVDEIMDALYVDMLKVAAERGGRAAVDAVWSDATRAARRRAPVVVAYARALARHGDAGGAADALVHLLQQDWHEPAIQLYGELEGGDAPARLKRAEEWLRVHREDPALLVACARLCVAAELYGKARSYLETSQQLRPRAETAQLLAHLLERLGERDRALKVLHEGLALATGRRVELPPVRQRRLGAAR
jgi:HemY protein